ncbi:MULTISPECIES: Yip1 family protein [unclassified Ruegeria]|uniref:Yip1 family protein n=1 Tax=unclassified Ruegeria TaxID=2625375 RepID=UPI00148A09D5|nr:MULTISPECIES: Yip1 family protein [unclassified Ruegeria]NOD33467.1 YIP1 family protein [Ruegeria sp. HKCCD7296]NOE40859.1 YIP1 family protein [Ruegeria sp. HKCCD7319]
MTIPPLGPLAVLTLRRPAEAARQILALDLGREAVWLAFALAVVISSLVQLALRLTAQTLPNDQPSQAFDSISIILLTSAGGLLLSVLAFLLVGRVLGGRATLSGLLSLMIWLSLLQSVASLAMALSTVALPAVSLLLGLATLGWSLYITLHFLNEAHQFGSLGKAFAVILLAAIVALPIVLMFTPTGPV